MDRDNNQNNNDKTPTGTTRPDTQTKNRAPGTAGNATKPGAVDITNPKPKSENASLTQLEQDLVAKQTGAAARSRAAARPGAVSVNITSPPSSSTLSQLEQDIAAKTRARKQPPGSSLATAVASTNQKLTQLELDIAAKKAARGHPTASPSQPGAVYSSGLSRLEQDIAAKASSASVTRPGAVHASGLSQLEQDIAVKASSASVSRPGAVPSSGLSQLEQDIAAKASSASATRPGVVHSSGMSQLEQDIAAKASTPTITSLSRLEQDIAAKSKSNTTDVASRPGAVASGGNGHLTQLEREIASKTSGMSAAQIHASSLTQLEQDVVAKTQARGHAASRPGASTSNGLSQLERDIVQKTTSGANGGMSITSTAAHGNPLTQLENDLMAKARAGGNMGNRKPPPSYSTTKDSDSNTKQSALMNRSNNNTSSSNRSALSNLESEILRKNAPAPSPMLPHPTYETPTHYPPYNPADDDYLTLNNVPLENTFDPRPEEAPAYHGSGDSGEEAGGIEAFVAEPNVVDAEAVEVIRTDEEEEVEAKKRQKKFVTYVILATIVLLMCVVVPLAVMSRKHGADSPAPTKAPTVAPTMAPTSQEIPKLAIDLSEYVQSLDDLRTKGTAQNSAMLWIAMEDEFSVNNGWDVKEERFIQRFVLAVMYFAFNGDNWRSCGRSDLACSADGSKQSWLTNTDECTWNMIQCNENMRVTGISNHAGSRNIVVDINGAMPQEISQLTYLQEINIFDLRIQGPLLTYISEMASLEVLNVHDSDFTGTFPSDFAAKHPLLTELDLFSNGFTGEIPELGGLQSLNVIDLSGNKFVGSIPSTIGSIQALTRLELRNNDLTGEVPSSLYALTDLLTLDLGGNSLRGTIANEIGNLKNLTEVSFGPSIMTGPLPPGLFSLTGLTIMRLHDSNFSGNLREEDFAQIANTISLIKLENNDFSGPIPIEALEAVQVLEELYLYGNPKLTGSITQSLCKKRGTRVNQINNLEVGCNILCAEGCCDDICEGWPTSSSDLPN